MHSIRQKCRPKHQVLVLKCYPRTTKGAVDVKPNSSELSYLLYYATARRSKVQKVGSFLDTKTASDVWRARIGNVQVTLQIFEALIEKAPRDLALYARYVLRILGYILKSGDITMVEASIPTFEAFCEHQDGASLSADQEYLQQYEEVVRAYTSFASTHTQLPASAATAPVAIRWKVAGLRAVKSVASSQALGSLAGGQLDVIMPTLFENLSLDNQQYLEVVLDRAHSEEKAEAENLLGNRGSIATVRTGDLAPGTNPLALSGTAADADKQAEEDIGVLAVRCLKQIFVANNRSLIRNGTFATVKFIADKAQRGQLTVPATDSSAEDRDWATTIFLMIARWTPVQERYTILVTAMEVLIQSSLSEDCILQDIVLTTMIGSLLRSDINLIGLSVMDILLGFVQHVIRLLQLNGAKSHSQHTGYAEVDNEFCEKTSPIESSDGVATDVSAPSKGRADLLRRLEQCIGDLATHVYYADQISDMISAILLRLKPTPISAAASAPATENLGILPNIGSQPENHAEIPSTDGVFAFDTAKISALAAIKQILLVATRRSDLIDGNLGRNRVGIRVWDSTQVLLRDADGRVREAYVDALLTWLDRETTGEDFFHIDDMPLQASRRSSAQAGVDDATDNLSKRVVSATSHREKTGRIPTTSFIQLLHLAIYENALQFTNSEPDLALLHLLLAKLVDKMGIHAVACGLPMIFRLQEDIEDAEVAAKIRIGSLCYGYLWTLTKKFDFESSDIGREIHNEVHRRQEKGLWVNSIKLPPLPLQELGMPGTTTTRQGASVQELNTESLKPFDGRLAMVELIFKSYSDEATATSSPATTSGHKFNFPTISHPQDARNPVEANSEKFREHMLSDWNKESILASAVTSSKSASLHGSKTGTSRTGQGRNHLAVVGGAQSTRTQRRHHSRPPSQAYGMTGMSKLRESTDPDPSAVDTSKTSTSRVDQLKRVLTGQAPPSRGAGTSHSSSSSDSMVSCDGSPSEFLGSRPPSSDVENSTTGSDAFTNADDDNIPPVPPLPASMSIGGGYPSMMHSKPATPESLGEYAQDGRGQSRGRQAPASRGQESGRDGEAGPGLDLESLLKGIHDGNGKQKPAGMVEPPY